ncbi:ankyrin repeat domain-containing protein [bacterium]|nr:ankyrin repeat domain-containing protein [bacterium]
MKLELHNLARIGDEAELASAISAGLKLNERNKARRTPIWIAARHANVSCIQILLNAGADCSITDGNGRTCLFAAAAAPSSDSIRLICKILSPNDPDPYGKRPLHIAARHGLLQNVCALIECGADHLIKDKYGSLPLDEARRGWNSVKGHGKEDDRIRYQDVITVLSSGLPID